MKGMNWVVQSTQKTQTWRRSITVSLRLGYAWELLCPCHFCLHWPAKYSCLTSNTWVEESLQYHQLLYALVNLGHFYWFILRSQWGRIKEQIKQPKHFLIILSIFWTLMNLQKLTNIKYKAKTIIWLSHDRWHTYTPIYKSRTPCEEGKYTHKKPIWADPLSNKDRTLWEHFTRPLIHGQTLHK